MLEIDIEAKHGVLFVRLSGNLTKNEKTKFNKEVTQLIEKVSINNLVINIKKIKQIDNVGKRELIKCYQKCNSIFCTKENERNLKEYKKVTDELSALKLLKL